MFSMELMLGYRICCSHIYFHYTVFKKSQLTGLWSPRVAKAQ